MTTRKEMTKINKLLEIIKKEKTISKVNLVMKSGISISYFEKLRPFLLEIYGHFIEYDKDLKIYKYVENREVPQTV